MKELLLLISLFFCAHFMYPQKEIQDIYFGTYSDSMTELEVRPDKTFRLKTIDYVYPNTFDSYTNEGNWEMNGKELILNPNLEKRKPTIEIKEQVLGNQDSITIQINYFHETYEKQEFKSKSPYLFEMLTMYFNKKKNYKTITREWVKQRSCAFAARIKNRVTIDSTNTIRMAKTHLDKIGFFTYGFSDFVELDIVNPKADYVEVTIVQPIDIERMPRSKRVKVNRNFAYFYENRKGNLDVMAMPLKRVQN